jgi:hypothetical protein
LLDMQSITPFSAAAPAAAAAAAAVQPPLARLAAGVTQGACTTTTWAGRQSCCWLSCGEHNVGSTLQPASCVDGLTVLALCAHCTHDVFCAVLDLLLRLQGFGKDASAGAASSLVQLVSTTLSDLTSALPATTSAGQLACMTAHLEYQES